MAVAPVWSPGKLNDKPVALQQTNNLLNHSVLLSFGREFGKDKSGKNSLLYRTSQCYQTTLSFDNQLDIISITLNPKWYHCLETGNLRGL